ncbi:MAG: FAD-dependent oxidoreductase [bacterium]
MSEPDVIVIGGGLAGLSAAALLSRAGASVVLVEEEHELGGRMQSLLVEGFRMDAGLHCFHYSDDGPLADLSRELSLGLSFIFCESPSYILKGKNRLPIPPGATADPERVPGFSEDEASRIRSWFDLIMDSDPEEWKKKSVAEFLSHTGMAEDELIKDYAGAFCLTLMGRDPAEVSASLAISHSRAVGHPGFHVSVIEGGPGRLVEALSHRLSENNAGIVLGSRVQSIELRDKQVRRVVTSSQEYRPEAVVYTGSLSALPALISGDGPSTGLVRKSKRLRPVSGISLEYGLNSSVTDVEGVMISPAEGVIGRFPTNLDASLAPEECQISSWLLLAPSADLSEVKSTRSHIKRLKRIVSGQFPELPGQARWERLRVIPSILEAGPFSSLTDDKKFTPRFRQITNIFVAGDGVASAGVLSGVAASSAIQAAKLTKDYLEKQMCERL